MPKTLKELAQEAHIPAISTASVSSLSKGVIETQATGIVKNENDISRQSTAGEATIFEAASLTKPVFAYIVLKMVERGELDLKKPLHTICPFGPPTEKMRQHPNYQLLTAGMILSHQAGLPNWFNRDKPDTFDYVEIAGKKFNYSGEAYCFLRQVVEHLAGVSLETLAQREFKKIGMTNSSLLLPNNNNRAIGHEADGTPDKNEHFDGINPAASLYTTAQDYAKFLRACANDEFIKSNMFTPSIELFGNDTKGEKENVPDDTLKQLSWGLGIGLQKAEDGSTIAFHWGDNVTCRNFAALKLNQDGTYQAVACFTNSANGPVVFRQVCEPIVGDLSAVSQWLTVREKLPEPKVPEQEPVPRKVQSFVSQYQSYINSKQQIKEEKPNAQVNASDNRSRLK